MGYFYALVRHVTIEKERRIQTDSEEKRVLICGLSQMFFFTGKQGSFIFPPRSKSKQFYFFFNYYFQVYKEASLDVIILNLSKYYPQITLKFLGGIKECRYNFSNNSFSFQKRPPLPFWLKYFQKHISLVLVPHL